MVQSAAQTIANLVGQDIVAKSISLTQASSGDAIKMLDGALLNFSTADTQSKIRRVSSATLEALGAFRIASDALVGTGGSGDLIIYRHMYRGGGSPVLLVSNTAPTISAGFGAGASIVASNGSFAFRIDVGAASASGTIGLPVAANGWAVYCQNLSTNTATVFVTKQTATTTTTAVIGNYDAAGASQNWVANDNLLVIAHPY